MIAFVQPGESSRCRARSPICGAVCAISQLQMKPKIFSGNDDLTVLSKHEMPYRCFKLYLEQVQQPQGASIYYVREMFGILDPPLVCISRNLTVLSFVWAFFEPPLGANVTNGSPLTKYELTRSLRTPSSGLAFRMLRATRCPSKKSLMYPEGI